MPTKFRDTAKATFEEYFSGHDYDELVRCIQEWRAPAKHWQMVVDAINLVFEKSDRARQLLASALVRLASEQVLHLQQLLFALNAVLAAYDVRSSAGSDEIAINITSTCSGNDN